MKDKIFKIQQESGGGGGGQVRLLALPDIKTYQKTIEIKTKWHFCRNSQIDQWVRKSPEIDICLRIQLIFKKHFNSKNGLFK